MAHELLNYILHIDTYLISFVTNYGGLSYFLLFAVIFCETGLIVTPFLPGDSLLFAAGSIAAHPSKPLNIQLLFVILLIASILGNKLNYTVGRFLGPKVFSAESSWLLNKKHLIETHMFYQKHGGKTLIFARFIPIIRTFAPFVAGVGTMTVQTFSFYNIVSALCWVGSLLAAGYFFGNLPIVKDNFTLVIYSIMFLPLLPPILGILFRKRAA